MGGVARKGWLHLPVILLFCIGMVFGANGVGSAATAVGSMDTAPNGDTEVKAGLGIEKLELTGAASTFNIDAGTKIYGWARVQGVAAGGSVSIVFKKGDKEAYRKDISIPSTPYRIYAYRTFRAGDDGDWTILIAGPEGKELASTAIKVTLK